LRAGVNNTTTALIRILSRPLLLDKLLPSSALENVARLQKNAEKSHKYSGVHKLSISAAEDLDKHKKNLSTPRDAKQILLLMNELFEKK
jgi:hypothetical protein